MDDMINPLERIQEPCKERHQSYYRLSKAAEITYSTLDTMTSKRSMSSVPILFKLCQGFGTTISDFFGPNRSKQSLTSEQALCLSLFTTLPQEDKQLALAYLKGLSKTF